MIVIVKNIKDSQLTVLFGCMEWPQHQLSLSWDPNTRTLAARLMRQAQGNIIFNSSFFFLINCRHFWKNLKRVVSLWLHGMGNTNSNQLKPQGTVLLPLTENLQGRAPFLIRVSNTLVLPRTGSFCLSCLPSQLWLPPEAQNTRDCHLTSRSNLSYQTVGGSSENILFNNGLCVHSAGWSLGSCWLWLLFPRMTGSSC